MMSEGNEEIILPADNIISLSSDSEGEIEINDLKRNGEVNKVIDIYSSSGEEDTNNNGEKNDTTYMQKIRKIKRNSGKSYVTKKGNIVPAKIFQNEDCHCRKGCAKYISEQDRKDAFEMFWGLGDFNKQNLLLFDSVEREMVKRRRLANGKGSPRNWTFKYLLNSQNGKVSVCKRFFVDTFKISEGRLSRVLNSPNVGSDLRGMMIGSSRKLSEESIQHVQNHIKTFPVFESQNSHKKYLHPDLTLRKMFSFYKLYCEDKKIKAVNEWSYRKIFKKDFDLHFHLPTDTHNMKITENS